MRYIAVTISTSRWVLNRTPKRNLIADKADVDRQRDLMSTDKEREGGAKKVLQNKNHHEDLRFRAESNTAAQSPNRIGTRTTPS
jgi:hypothetical protein